MIRSHKLLAVLAGIVLLAAFTLTTPQSASANSNVRSARSGPPIVMEVCKEPRCIGYRHHRFLRCKYNPCDTKPIILQVPDYCCCCLVEVPVCIPCCCEGAPSICSHKGCFGRDVVEYSWCCGFHLKVVFDRCGNATVHYYGL
jgi:hypothetical protein